MKKILLGLVLMGAWASVSADDNTIYTYGFTNNSKTLTLSTTPASPTQIMTRDSYVRANWILGLSSFTVYLSSFNTTISTSQTTGNFSIPGVGTNILTPWQWTPDGPNSVYNGPLWAISQPQQTPAVISVFRSK